MIIQSDGNKKLQPNPRDLLPVWGSMGRCSIRAASICHSHFHSIFTATFSRPRAWHRSQCSLLAPTREGRAEDKNKYSFQSHPDTPPTAAQPGEGVYGRRSVSWNPAKEQRHLKG